jgi:hypothetical protein
VILRASCSSCGTRIPSCEASSGTIGLTIITLLSNALLRASLAPHCSQLGTGRFASRMQRAALAEVIAGTLIEPLRPKAPNWLLSSITTIFDGLFPTPSSANDTHSLLLQESGFASFERIPMWWAASKRVLPSVVSERLSVTLGSERCEMDTTQQAKSAAILLEESMLERMSSLGIVDGTCL